MNRTEFIKAVKGLGLSPQDYVVIGSGILAALGLRPVDDIDLIVSESVFRRFEQTGQWQRKGFEDGTYYLLKGIYEIGLDWDGPNARPNLTDLKNQETVIDGVPFIGLERLKTWKAAKGREKDLADLKLIDEHLKKQG